jgi:large-conductance mechanosensitive channel
MNFTLNEAVFAYGAFLQSVIQTAFTVVALFYLVVRLGYRISGLGPRV